MQGLPSIPTNLEKTPNENLQSATVTNAPHLTMKHRETEPNVVTFTHCVKVSPGFYPMIFFLSPPNHLYTVQ